MSDLNDQSMIQGLLTNDRSIIEKIYKDNFQLVCSFILNNNGDRDDAKDIFQEALVLLFEKAKAGNFVLSSRLSTYLYAVCRNIWFKRLGRQRSSIVSTADFSNEEADPQDDTDLELMEEKDKQYSLMDAAMAQLGEPCKTLLESFYVKKMEMKEIADQFGYTNPDNAKTQKYKCLMRLKKLFFERYNKK